MGGRKMTLMKSNFINEWKSKMKQIVKFRYPNLSDKKIDKYLDDQIAHKLNDRKLLLVNNYTSKVSRTTILELIDLIERNQLICAGGGCLFLQHKVKRNILIEFILDTMAGRKNAKAERKMYDKGTDEWDEADRKQLAYKLLINSLYGCLGYPGFIMFNIFLAEAITNQGRHIITTAINAIENFLGDAMWFENKNEVFNAINNIHNDYETKCKNKFVDGFIDLFGLDFTQLPDMVTERFINHCIFVYDAEFKNTLHDIFNNMNNEELILMYYKNNIMEFSRLPFIKVKLKELILTNGPLTFCEDSSYKDGHCVALVNDLWAFFQLFVLYDYPINDRVQKAMYLDKTKSLYTDTDSVFISLNEYVMFIKNEVFKDISESDMSDQDLTFTAVNVTLSFVNRMIASTLDTFCKSLNITPEFSKLLGMKNEFYFSRIMFQDVKKRYISLAMLQEGQLLGNGDGMPEIKGFDFIKAGTKPFVKDYYTKLCLEEILYPKEIKPQRIFKRILQLKYMMEDTIKNGNTEFFKQANVKLPEYYKNPYSTQGVCAILLWNALCPDKALEFPNDVNIVPIKELTFPRPPKRNNEASTGSPVRANIKKPMDYKGISEFANKFPEAYNRLNNSFYTNENALLRHMNLTSIAIPKNIDYELPDYIKYLMDIESIINDTLNLIIPIAKSVGINSFEVTSTKEYISNMVSL